MKSEYPVPKDVKAMSLPELNAYADMYAQAGDTVPADLKTKADFAAFIAEKIATVGRPHVVTQEDIDLNGTNFPNDIKVGDTVILPEPGMNAPAFRSFTCECGASWTGPGAPETCPECGKVGTEVPFVPAQNPSANPGSDALNPPVTPPASPTTGSGVQNAPIATPASAQQLYFQRRPILSHRTKLHNGRTYHEITTADSTSMLTEEEYQNDVKTSA